MIPPINPLNPNRISAPNPSGAPSDRQRVSQDPASRSQQIDQIRTQIKNGQFSVDFGSLAKAIIGSGALKE
ncbi:flagellar biosynthesis anti-sigma factor FlgM [Alicyclobacillus cycloheptanicus]|uniref:Anti-sigma28 factor (Negative regulator of flagellin synthesis) n=1 Tax=Alicyclobacillus cycloheptanicus TaxID=1457 RepID=A0ABT9XK59_9BACL|nr:flagellar biosynthesis anti-sigma factor FlgM [Alicyclobacillus cycloheptanicus]MDQ0190663.1 anti-sigma28 factor (negative regulator of flagellin synthesis) [Alicyclobacillus cycloheptanicus]WDM00319.1 flagellar biosynthesis anti-sigma factor FlgM [Alicyclobacillus cycloheptanicus]